MIMRPAWVTVKVTVILVLYVIVILLMAASHGYVSSSSGIELHSQDDLTLPPGFWIEYDHQQRGYRNCHDSFGTRSCWLSFSTQEEAIRDAQAFAKHVIPE